MGMSDDTVYNLIADSMRLREKSEYDGITFEPEQYGWTHVSGTATETTGIAYIPRTGGPSLVAGETYTITAQAIGDFGSGNRGVIHLYYSDGTHVSNFGHLCGNYADTMTFTVPSDNGEKTLHAWGPVISEGCTVDGRVRLMLVEGDTPAAWAPAEGETLSGGVLS